MVGSRLLHLETPSNSYVMQIWNFLTGNNKHYISLSSVNKGEKQEKNFILITNNARDVQNNSSP
jgi:hypothetical protein